MKEILFLVIEGNSNKGCGGSGGVGQEQFGRLLEEEAEFFLSRWYSDSLNPVYSKIECHLICPSNCPPSEGFIKKLTQKHSLVHYTHCPHDESDHFPAGWFNTPLAGAWLENNISFDKAIHLDLDMILLRPFQSSYLNFKGKEIAKCATYHPDFPDDLTEMDGVPKEYVTCFITSTKQGRFYNKWWGVQATIQKEYEQKFGDSLFPSNKELWWRYCNIEEHAVDKMALDDPETIGKIEYSQFGRSQGYGSIQENIEHIDKLNFLHCHINNDWKDQLSDYAKTKLDIYSGRAGLKVAR